MKRFLLITSLVIGFTMMGCTSQNGPGPDELSELTIAQIHEAFEEGEYTSRQLVEAFRTRIKQMDSTLNSISVLNPAADSIARSLDEEYERTGELRPLHGIPLIVKDNINTKGLPTTAGSRALEDFIPEEDAFIIQRLVEAGAVIIAKSNMAEWAFSPMHTESSTRGTTRNPYNTDHVPAGSSGGTGASIAANFGVIGLGTDTGNSIRGPSSHNALVGFRSTQGLVSRSAIVPLYLRNDIVGPMTRTVEDATKVLEVIAGQDTDDPITRHSEEQIPENYTQFLVEDGLQGARIGVLRELSENDPDSAVHALFEDALSDLEELGAEIVDPVEIPDFASLRRNQWCSEFRTDVEAFLSEYVKRDSLQTLEDIIRVGTASDFARMRLEQTAGSSGRAAGDLECGNVYTDERMIAFREAITGQMDALELDAIVYPSWNHPPARIEAFQEEYRGDNSQVIAPHTGMPAFTVPMGYTAGDLPAGLQFLGRMYDEPTLIRLTYGYEQGTQHRKPPEPERGEEQK